MLGNQWCLFERNHQSCLFQKPGKVPKDISSSALGTPVPIPTDNLPLCLHSPRYILIPPANTCKHISPVLVWQGKSLRWRAVVSFLPLPCFHSTITASQLESKALLLLLLSLENHCLLSSFATRPMPAALPYLKTAPFRTHWPHCEGEGEQDWSSALDKT